MVLSTPLGRALPCSLQLLQLLREFECRWCLQARSALRAAQTKQPVPV